MNARSRQLLLEVLELSAKDRTIIAAELEASLEDEDVSPEEIEKAWADEIQRRVAEVREGRVKLVPAAKVLRDARKRLHARR